MRIDRAKPVMDSNHNGQLYSITELLLSLDRDVIPALRSIRSRQAKSWLQRTDARSRSTPRPDRPRAAMRLQATVANS